MFSMNFTTKSTEIKLDQKEPKMTMRHCLEPPSPLSVKYYLNGPTKSS